MEDPMAGRSRGPLSGVRVVEVGVWHAGPGAGAIMADLGAEVIKVESLGSDPERLYGGFGHLDGKSPLPRPDWNVLFEVSNRNKQGIALDISTQEGQEILHRLVEGADVFLTNLRNGTKSRLGIEYDALRAVNSRIVYLNVSAFGPKGPLADGPGFDTLGQAVSGMMYMTGSEEPAALSMLILDQLTAIAASHAVIAALLSRELHGAGQEVHASLYGAGMWLQHANYLIKSIVKEPVDLSWDRLDASPLRTTYVCKDGKWIVGTGHPPERYWPQFCTVLGRPDLLTDARFATRQQRQAAKSELFAELDSAFLQRNRSEWLEIMSQSDLPFAPVNGLAEVLVDPQAIENGYVQEFEHPYLGSIKVPGYPVSFGGHVPALQSRAPELGEHTRPILESLGYDAQTIDLLHKKRVVKLFDADQAD
ncbi:CoA transferase [Rhodococcus olei]|uniref:CoA transferase n=1 Tax=Rhodococcus olei TaxID=2161675 RepID=A0ABP8PUU2_9NOCA